MIVKTTKRPSGASAPVRTINAGTRSITASAIKRQAATPIKASRNIKLTPEQQIFANQLANTIKRSTKITAATNTSNIPARPDFLELLPLFVQKLILTDVFGSVPMNSRQQLIPYFKFVAENTKGETAKGTILSSPFANLQGVDPNFTGRIVKNEAVSASTLVYTPVLPGTVTISADNGGVVTKATDDGAGHLLNAAGTQVGTINYATGAIGTLSGTLTATYQYDNETVGPDADGNYGAKMAKGYLELSEINLIAEAHDIACYWSIYSAFAAQQEYGGNIADIAKEAAISELTAEINTAGFALLASQAQYAPQFNWDAAPILSGAVVPSDYLNMFKLKLNQASAAIYSATRLSQANRLVVGTNVAAYLGMVNGFNAAPTGDNVGPYKLGTLDQFEVYVDPSYDINKWVMCCKNNDIRRNTALFGEYMPIVSTDAIGLANASVQQGTGTMYGMKVVNPATCISGKILGTF